MGLYSLSKWGFTHRSPIRKIRVINVSGHWVALKHDNGLGSSADELSAIFQSDVNTRTWDLAASRLSEILRKYVLMNRGFGYQPETFTLKSERKLLVPYRHKNNSNYDINNDYKYRFPKQKDLVCLHYTGHDIQYRPQNMATGLICLFWLYYVLLDSPYSFVYTLSGYIFGTESSVPPR